MKSPKMFVLFVIGVIALGVMASWLPYSLEKASWEGEVALAQAIEEGKYIPPCDYAPHNRWGCTKFGVFYRHSEDAVRVGWSN